jgi:hypothetical protein
MPSFFRTLVSLSSLSESEVAVQRRELSQFMYTHITRTKILEKGVLLPKPYTAKLVYTHILTYLLTYLLTPHSTVLLEKLTGLQLVKKYPAFYGTRKFIPAFTTARHQPLS